MKNKNYALEFVRNMIYMVLCICFYLLGLGRQEHIFVISVEVDISILSVHKQDIATCKVNIVIYVQVKHRVQFCTCSLYEVIEDAVLYIWVP